MNDYESAGRSRTSVAPVLCWLFVRDLVSGDRSGLINNCAGVEPVVLKPHFLAVKHMNAIIGSVLRTSLRLTWSPSLKEYIPVLTYFEDLLMLIHVLVQLKLYVLFEGITEHNWRRSSQPPPSVTLHMFHCRKRWQQLACYKDEEGKLWF